MRGVLSAITAIAVLGLCEPLRLGAQNNTAPDWTRINSETLEHFQALVRLDTQNPPGNEYRVTDYVKSVLEKEGIPVQIFALDPKRPNMVARLKGNGKKKPLLYMGHSDVVTVDPRSGPSAFCAISAAATSTDGLKTIGRTSRRRAEMMLTLSGRMCC
jgi:arginine utilization protein RocB